MEASHKDSPALAVDAQRAIFGDVGVRPTPGVLNRTGIRHRSCVRKRTDLCDWRCHSQPLFQPAPASQSVSAVNTLFPNPTKISMSQKIVLNIALTLALAASASAFAQSHGPAQSDITNCPNGRCEGAVNQPRPGQNVRRPAAPPQQAARNDWQNNYHRAAPNERGAGPNQSFHQGGRLPPEYNGRQYVVDDWRGHHLSAPPRGYHWVQNGGDYLLVAITTGIIMQLLLSN
jgi:Ni/Co efflux regulator RcnB